MKFTCERDSLIKVLTDASRGVASRLERAILGCLHLSLTDDLLTVTATDLNLWTQASIKVADGGTPGTTAIQPRYLVDAIRSCEPGIVSVEQIDTKVQVTSGASEFTFNVMDPDTFPQMPEVDFQEVTLDAEDFLASLTRVLPARSVDNSPSSVYTGMQLTPLDGGDSKLRLLCTDTYRLAEQILVGTDLSPLKDQVIVPGEVLEEISRHAGSAESITIGISDSQIAFTIGDLFFLAQFIDGVFPNPEKIIPDRSELADYPHKLVLSGGGTGGSGSDGDSGGDSGGSDGSDDLGTSSGFPKDRLKRALNQVRIMGGTAEATIRLNMAPGKLTLHSESDYGSGHVEMDVDYTGEPLTLGFNHKYLLNGIEACPGDELSLFALNEAKPVVLLGEMADDFMYILMPLRVTD